MSHLTPPPSQGNTPLRPATSAPEPIGSPTRLSSALRNASQPDPAQPSTSANAPALPAGLGDFQPIEKMDLDKGETDGLPDIGNATPDNEKEDDDLDEGSGSEEEGEDDNGIDMTRGGLGPPELMSDSEEEDLGLIDETGGVGSGEEGELEEDDAGAALAGSVQLDDVGGPSGGFSGLPSKPPPMKGKGGKGKGKGKKEGQGEGRGKENELYEADIVFKWNNKFGDVVWDNDHPALTAKRG